MRATVRKRLNKVRCVKAILLELLEYWNSLNSVTKICVITVKGLLHKTKQGDVVEGLLS